MVSVIGKCSTNIIMFVSYIFLFLTCPLSIWICFRRVNEYERLVIFRLGRIRSGKAKGPGLIFILPCTDHCYSVDLRVVTFDIPPQEILTKDSVTISVNAVVYYKVSDPLSAITKVSSYRNATELLGATTLRNVLGAKNLTQLLTDRESISVSMQSVLDEATEAWGIKVDRVEIKDVALPMSMQRAMAAEGESTREATAKVIAAEGELKASRALKEAADVMASNSTTIQLRYLQTLHSISTEKNTTVVFPLPVSLIRKIFNLEAPQQATSSK